MSVTVTNISKYYGKQKALDNVSFSLKKGEVCGFLGPNGAGKSTMMKIITGFLMEFEGEVTANTISVRQFPLKAKAIIGYLPEHNPLYPDMYIQEYLQHVAHLYKTPHSAQKVDEIMQLTGLIPERKKKIGQLSKGYRQRVGLAQALVHDPEILILDEPMTGLDPNQLEEIRNLIINIGKDKTVMLSTHVMQEVEAICNRIIIINQGAIVTDQYKQEIHAGHNHLLIDVRFAGNTKTEWLSELKDITDIKSLEPDYFRLTAAMHTDPRIELFQKAAAHQCPIIELKIEEQNLEEVFKKLTVK